MKQLWRNSLAALIGGVSLFNFSLAESVDCFDCCSFSVCDWDFTAGVDYLYWKSCTNEQDYVVKPNKNLFPASGNSGDIDFDVNGICPDYESGYRIYVKGSSFSGSSFGLAGSYTQLNSEKNGSETAGNFSLLPTTLHPYQEQYLSVQFPTETLSYESASAEWKSDYRDWTVGVTYTSNWKCFQRTEMYFGIAGMHFDENFDAVYALANTVEMTDVSAYSKSYRDFSGWGIKAGTQYEYNLCGALNLFTQVNGTILVGDGENETTFGFNGVGSENPLVDDYIFKKDDCCRVVPGYHLSLGANYESCLCNFNLMFRVGYEFVGWFNLPSQRTYVEGFQDLDSFTDPRSLNIALSSFDHGRDLFYHGLYAGLEVKF